MSYIAFDLDALNAAPAVARAAGMREEDVIAGLVRMWAWCFRERTDHVSPMQVRGHFGADATEALAAFGFLASAGNHYRVRGADRYLRVTESRSKAGKARADAAGRCAGRFTSTPPAPDQHSTSTDQHSTSTSPALTPSTEHRTPIETTLSSSLDLALGEAPRKPNPDSLNGKLTDDEWQVFEHWRVTLGHPRAVATSERKRLIAKWLPVYGVNRLQTAIDGVLRSPHHMGQNDRHTRYDQLELILRDAKHIESFEQLAGVAA